MSSLFPVDDPTTEILAQIPRLAELAEPERIVALNRIRSALHEISPFRNEPVDCVLWVPAESVHSNDYNPNSVAPPEMKLLEVSVLTDGYTQPVVTVPDDPPETREVVDGFHRTRIGKECPEVKERTRGYLPVVTIRESQNGKLDRMAATIRHNRARGKHAVSAMSDIVAELKRRGWEPTRIAKELGMSNDEVLRLAQVTGLAELFADRQFSEAWEARPKRKVKPKTEGGVA